MDIKRNNYVLNDVTKNCSLFQFGKTQPIIDVCIKIYFPIKDKLGKKQIINYFVVHSNFNAGHV